MATVILFCSVQFDFDFIYINKFQAKFIVATVSCHRFLWQAFVLVSSMN